MNKTEGENFPVVKISFNGSNSDELVNFQNTCDYCLSKQQPFGFININENNEMNAHFDPEIIRKNKLWLKKNKAKLVKYLKGFAFVIKSQELSEKFGEIFITNTELTYGCPAIIASSTEEGETWLKEKLNLN